MSRNVDPDEVSFEERQQYGGLALSLVSMATYLAIVITRAATDDRSLHEVAWRGPMLLVLAVGGGLYGLAYLVARLRHRGPTEDARDREISRYGESVGGGLAGLTVFVTIILLTLDVDSFWVAHNLFFGSWFANFVGTASKAAAYREGIPS